MCFLSQNALLMCPGCDEQDLIGIFLRYVADWEIMSTFAADFTEQLQN